MNVHTGATHQVLNQARAATGWNAFSEDAVLQAIVTRSVPWVADKATALGKHAGDADTQELARLAPMIASATAWIGLNFILRGTN